MEKSWEMKAAWAFLSYVTARRSKIVESVYDVYVETEKYKLEEKIMIAKLKAAETYYVQGAKYGYNGLHRFPAHGPCELLTEAQWKYERKYFTMKLKEHGGGVAAHTY